MNEGILVSVIMAARNAEGTIEEAIQSVAVQTYHNWELIVIDDGSQDGTCSKIKRMAKKEPRIRFKRNGTNLGVSRTRNRGVSIAKGDWIAFLDSDDIWKPDKLEKQVNLIREREDADLVYTGSGFLDRLGETIPYRQQVPERITYRQLLKQNIISCSSVLIRRELILKYPMPCDVMHEDYAVWLMVLKHGGHAYGIQEPLLIYRLSADSKSGNKAKSAEMTWRVYRFTGLSLIQTLYYFVWYICKNMKKYLRIYWLSSGIRRESCHGLEFGKEKHQR